RLLERAHHRRHVQHALAGEALLEPPGGALHVAEVDVDDLPPGTEVADAPQHVSRAAHLRPAADAEEQPRTGAVHDLRGALEALEAAHDPRHAADVYARRVVRMERQPDTRLLRDRDHLPE